MEAAPGGGPGGGEGGNGGHGNGGDDNYWYLQQIVAEQAEVDAMNKKLADTVAKKKREQEMFRKRSRHNTRSRKEPQE